MDPGVDAAEDQNEASGGDDDDDAKQVASESGDRSSSSFLFDSLPLDGSLLAGPDPDPHQAVHQSDESERVGQEVRDEERRRGETSANREAEEQEAVQWGESSFNLSEWGDSLLVGEHFLERQSLLSLRRGQRPGTERVLSEQEVARPPPGPGERHAKSNSIIIIAPNELRKDKAEDNQGHTHKGGREEEREEEGNVFLPDPPVQHAPERTLYCSPDLQEIFDRWPSMSDQPWQHVTTGVTATHTHTQTHTAAAANTPGDPETAGQSNPPDEEKSRPEAADCKAEKVAERPGSAGDVIPPTQTHTPVTPRVKLTTLSVHSPLAARPLNQSTPSNLLPDQPVPSEGPGSRSDPAHPPDAPGKRPQSTSDLTRKNSETLPEPQPKPPSGSDTCEIDEGFSLQLSQDPSLSPAVSGPFSIIDVASDRRLFRTFISEWRSKRRYSLALACERREAGDDRAHQKSDAPDGFPVRGSDGVVLTGLCVCWGAKDAYYISLQQEQGKGLSASLAPPALDQDLSVSERLEGVKARLHGPPATQEGGALITYDIIKAYKTLVQSCGVSLEGECEDPKVACWLLDPGSQERTLPNMVTVYCPEELHLLDGLGNAHAHCPRVRAATESVLVHAVMTRLTPLLEKDGMLDLFRRMEMPSQKSLALLELNGVGFSVEECERQKHVMQAKLSALESQAYALAGRSFSLTSIDDVAQVLYLELHLPPNGDVGGSKSKKTLGYARRGAGRVRLGKQFSTTKDVLEKLRPLHPLPGVILEWRRITNALTKVVFPLQREKQHHAALDMDRIYPIAQTHTATGRVSFTEPNIQNVPKDFEICMATVVSESPPSQERRTRSGKRQAVAPSGPAEGAARGPAFSVSMRHAFVPFTGGMILAVDYSQLELRVLAHLSKDQRLLQVLNGGADVFRCIAAEWKSVDPEAVNDSLRQQAKQICYGIIYGMGAKSLGEQMGVEENDAACYIESFKARYRGINAFLRETVKSCVKHGYVQTLLGRRRYLPGITHANTHQRAHAERQAVNTTVQGSAADIVKLATVNIQTRLRETYPTAPLSHQHHPAGHRRRPRASNLRGAYFVLQLHDELIYETTEEDFIQVAQIVKKEMESAVKLYVKLKAKVKAGPSWGNLQDLDI